MAKGFMFCVYIGKKVLGPFGEIKNSLQIYYLCCSVRNSWKAFGKQSQVFEIFHRIICLCPLMYFSTTSRSFDDLIGLVITSLHPASRACLWSDSKAFAV